MDQNLIHPVILSGGVGSRLWPLSRALYPKQLLPLVSDRTMIQETARRVAAPERFARPVVVANEEHRFIIAEQLREAAIVVETILLEPVGRNTAPAVALAALFLLDRGQDPLMLVMPSDHVIRDNSAFCAAVDRAREAARSGMLVTFGVTPDRPETGYGYIERGAELAVDGVHDVSAFVEKPNAETAARYLETGRFLWNAGIFMFSARTYLDVLGRHAPEILDACKAAMADCVADLDFHRPDREAFMACPSESIDYAVMEKTDRAAVVPVDMGWSDVGSWAALWELADKDPSGNAIKGDVIALDTHDSLVRSEGPAVATVGVDNLVVVATDDAVLVANKDKVQNVKQVVDAFARSNRSEHMSHTVVYRPWGSYQTADAGERFQVKRLVVKPGEQLSLQKHLHRAEHWVVVKGTAKVTRGDETFILHENESTYIPIGEVHRLENPGKIPLYIVEVQSGAYLGEDDIVRFDDTYGRS
ncbi:MAG: mannose-1-phosphate guanylyltransferase/mannose-6-phosphate isomerase [Alphaproteobacteria bacterium]|nr:MAG: mannose-1-phosphate guanylyltransferase/mannose-6-phosphate isomerase [Alphaproteobacteria bacterium]